MRQLQFLLIFILANPGLAQTKYDSSQRPDPAGAPTRVEITMFIIDVEGIDNLQQNFTADFVLVQRWHDARVSEPVGTRLPLDTVWHPDTHLYNLRDASERMARVVTIFPGDTVDYIQRYYGKFSTFLDFREFPFDRQNLPFTLMSFTYGPQEVELVVKRIGKEDRFSISGWDIAPTGTKISAFVPEFTEGTGKELTLCRFDYTLEASRHLNYYWWKVVAPLAIIVFLSWAVFYIDPSQVGAQIGVSATSILTLIAFLLRLEKILPPVSYLTHMDHFVFATLALVFLAYVEAIVSTTLALNNKKMLALRLDRWSRFISPAHFTLLMIYYWA